MFPSDPRAALAAMPYLVGAAPLECIMLAAFDDSGRTLHAQAIAATADRPLDEPLLEVSLWGPGVSSAAIVAYTEFPAAPLERMIEVWNFRDITPIAAVWANDVRWRSYLCDNPRCCPPGGNSYAAPNPGHDDYAPIPPTHLRSIAWRHARWNAWLDAIARTQELKQLSDEALQPLAAALHDIPVRDALLAHSAADPEARASIAHLLERMTRRSTVGAAIPAQTCFASLQYLEGDLAGTAQRVQAVLDAEEYSLARLLRNGLDMRAPASLLARSFAHYSPADLLAA